MAFKFKIATLTGFLCFLGMSIALGPSPPLPFELPKFLEDIRQNFPEPPKLSRGLPFGQLEGLMNYRSKPLEIEAGFHLKPPRRNQPLLAPPPFWSPFSLRDLRNLQNLKNHLFTPSRQGEIAETPGQVRNYEMDLKEIKKENENALNEITTNKFTAEDASDPPTSFVHFGITGDDNREYKYNYSVL
ncbi:hypothetical protein HHI36_012599 [Cryptolaemus montrouzieri]|uniref:Uncharacterized protein n=1 Tax=Cryptolaemus montrouzieri TaxID=559131 RepID=A0ABD2NEP6_9CUCU